MKGIILDELCATTGWHRNHARKALSTALQPKLVSPRSPRPPKYGPDVIAALTVCWTVLGMPAGKRLAPMLDELVAVLHPELPKGVEDRDADCWEPLLTVADLAGGDWPERARVASVAHVAQDGVKNMPTEGIELLADIKAVFDKLQVKAIFTVDLLAELGNMDRRWRRLDGRGLARTLHSYGMNETHRDQRIGAVVKKGYRREYFDDAWSRYLPPRATGATGATDGSDNDE